MKLMLALALLPLILVLAPAAGAADVTVDNTTLFKFAAHGTYMNFSSGITSDRITVSAENATFTNIQMGGSSYTTSSWVIGVENADATVTALEEENIGFELDASTGVKSLATMTDGGRGEPERVKLNDGTIMEHGSLGALHSADEGWFYAGGVIYVKTTHPSPNDVFVDWSALSGVPQPQPQPQPQPSSPEPSLPTQSSEIPWAWVATVGCLLVGLFTKHKLPLLIGGVLLLLVMTGAL